MFFDEALFQFKYIILSNILNFVILIIVLQPVPERNISYSLFMYPLNHTHISFFLNSTFRMMLLIVFIYRIFILFFYIGNAAIDVQWTLSECDSGW